MKGTDSDVYHKGAGSEVSHSIYDLMVIEELMLTGHKGEDAQ